MWREGSTIGCETMLLKLLLQCIVQVLECARGLFNTHPENTRLTFGSKDVETRQAICEGGCLLGCGLYGCRGFDKLLLIDLSQEGKREMNSLWINPTQVTKRRRYLLDNSMQVAL
jgi:hypothetical protein